VAVCVLAFASACKSYSIVSFCNTFETYFSRTATKNKQVTTLDSRHYIMHNLCLITQSLSM